jgi:hypothetical protein
MSSLERMQTMLEHVLEFYQNLYERPQTFRSETALPGV